MGVSFGPVLPPAPPLLFGGMLAADLGSLTAHSQHEGTIGQRGVATTTGLRSGAVAADPHFLENLNPDAPVALGFLEEPTSVPIPTMQEIVALAASSSTLTSAEADTLRCLLERAMMCNRENEELWNEEAAREQSGGSLDTGSRLDVIRRAAARVIIRATKGSGAASLTPHSLLLSSAGREIASLGLLQLLNSGASLTGRLGCSVAGVPPEVHVMPRRAPIEVHVHAMHLKRAYGKSGRNHSEPDEEAEAEAEPDEEAEAVLVIKVGVKEPVRRIVLELELPHPIVACMLGSSRTNPIIMGATGGGGPAAAVGWRQAASALAGRPWGHTHQYRAVDASTARSGSKSSRRKHDAAVDAFGHDSESEGEGEDGTAGADAGE